MNTSLNGLMSFIALSLIALAPTTVHAQEDAGFDNDAGVVDAGSDASIDAAAPDYARPDYSPLQDEGGVGWACSISVPGAGRDGWLLTASWASLALGVEALRRSRRRLRASNLQRSISSR